MFNFNFNFVPSRKFTLPYTTMPSVLIQVLKFEYRKQDKGRKFVCFKNVLLTLKLYVLIAIGNSQPGFNWEGRIFSYREMLLLNWRPPCEGVKLVSNLVLARSPSTRILAQVLVPLSLTSMPSVEELFFIHFNTHGTNSISSLTGGKLVRDKF